MSRASDFHHVPVLFDACMEALAVRPDGMYMDGTLGGGGHSSGILSRLGPQGFLLALDRDPMALEAAALRLKEVQSGGAYALVHSTFADFDKVLQARKIKGLDGVLLDLGISSAQVDLPERGFSYNQDGPLDMRMNAESGRSAAELVNTESEEELKRILRVYGEERYAGRIAGAICRRRVEKPFTRTLDLAELIAKAMPPAARREKQHPAKRSFQALRIAVNEELKQLEIFLEKIPDYMNNGGRICLISFHSLEDRLIKQTMRTWEKDCICPPNAPICTCGKISLGRCIDRKGITAEPGECEENPRARSARLRVFEIKRDSVKE